MNLSLGAISSAPSRRTITFRDGPAAGREGMIPNLMFAWCEDPETGALYDQDGHCVGWDGDRPGATEAFDRWAAEAGLVRSGGGWILALTAEEGARMFREKLDMLRCFMDSADDPGIVTMEVMAAQPCLVTRIGDLIGRQGWDD